MSKASPPSQLLSEKQETAAPGPPAYSSSTFTTTFASISLHMTDKIRFLQFTPDDLALFRTIVKRAWPRGIQAERPYSVSQEFKLYGNPWRGTSNGSDSTSALVLVRELLSGLFARGWILTAATDISHKEFDKDTLLFRKQPVPPPAATWMSISFYKGDKLRFIGAPRELIVAFQSLLRSLRLLQSEAMIDTRVNMYEFKMNGYPWRATGEETMRTRLLILRVIELLERHGWSLYASIDQNNGPQGDSNWSETDVWYCVKSNEWTPGSPVFHR
jgi:hypothetical protein